MSAPSSSPIRDRTVSMSSVNSSLSIDEQSPLPATPNFRGGKSPTGLSPIFDGPGASSPYKDRIEGGLQEAGRSTSMVEMGVGKGPLMEPYMKREVMKREQFIVPPNSNNHNPNNNVRVRSRRTESVDSYENPYEEANTGRIVGRQAASQRAGQIGYGELQRILSTFKPATRTPFLCEKIVKYLEQSTMVKTEAWYMILSTSKKKDFFKSLKYKKVVDDHGLQFDLSSTTRTKYYILLRGNCSVTLPNGKTFNLRAGDTFGGLQMPPNLAQYAADVKARGSYKGRETLSEVIFTEAVGGRKIRAGRGNKINVTVPKGGEIAVLSSKDVREILEKISLKLSTTSLLTTLGLRCMEKNFKTVKLKAGQVLQEEGAVVKKIYAIISGECKCMKKTVHVPEIDSGKEGGILVKTSFAESGVNFDKRIGRKVELKKIVLRNGFKSNASTSNLMIYGPKSIVGDIEVLLGTNAETTVVCKCDVVGVSFDPEIFRDRLGNYTDLKNQFIKLARIRRSLIATQLARALGYVEMAEGVDWEKEVEEGGERIRRVWREEREKEQRVMKRMMEEMAAGDGDTYDDFSSARGGSDNSDEWSQSEGTVGGRGGGLSVGGLGVKAAKLNQRSVDHRGPRSSTLHGVIFDEEEKKEEEKEDRSIWVNKMTNSAVFPPENLDVGPPEITFEMVFQRRVKKNPRVNRAKLMLEFKRLLLNEKKSDGPIEYEEPKDRFERLDYIDTSGYEFTDTVLNFMAVKGDGDGESYDLSLLTPFPTLTRARKLHGKPLPVLPHSAGFLNPVKAFGEVRQRSKQKLESRECSIEKSDKAMIKKALDDGFYPHFQSGLSIFTRPSTVAGSVASGSVHGGRGGLVGSGLGQRSSLLSSSFGTYEERTGGGPGRSIWEEQEDQMQKLYGDEKQIGYYDITKRKRPRSKLVGIGAKGR